MSENIEKNEVKTETTVEKKSWFNRVWSAMSGLIVGIAAMFGIKQTQINEIRNDMQNVYDQVQNIKTAIDNKDLDAAATAVGNASDAITEVIGDVKVVGEIAKENWETYKATINEIKLAIQNKNYSESHDKAVLLASKILGEIPEDEMTGKTREIYQRINGFINDVKDGKYDSAIDTINKIGELF
jgi:hypothetical protein